MRPLTHDAQFIIRKLEYTEQDYCERVEAGGYEWLNRYFSHAPDVIRLYSYSKKFWQWWVNQWEIRDKDFVKACKNFHPWPPHISHKLYDGFHNIAEISIRPNRWVIKELEEMVQKEELKQYINKLNEAA